MITTAETAAILHLLVVEDDALHKLLLEHEFEGQGYDVKSAGDASEALALLSPEAGFEVGIFDLKIPPETGAFPTVEGALQVIERARHLFPTMVIVTISSVFLGEELRERLTELRVETNFPKPFSHDKLHQLVDSCRSSA